MTKPIKLSRAQIKEGLKHAPIDQILLGADKIRLTKKQKDFAQKVAEGKPKAQAYREAYDSQGKPATEGREGHRLAQNPKINTMIEAFQLANQAREYLIPTQIRTMAIQNLVSISIDEGEKTSNKLKALELIGKMSEVALFTERKEIIHTTNSADIKAKLIEGLRLAFAKSSGVNELAKRKAESLLVELSDPRQVDTEDETPDPSTIPAPATPPTPDPQISTFFESDGLHSNPLKESPSHTNSSITDVIVQTPLESDTSVSIGSNPDAFKDDSNGGGVINLGQPAPNVSHETPPHVNSGEKG